MALGDVIAKLSVHLGLETAAFEKGSKRAETRMSGFEKNMSRASSAVKTAFVGMLGVFAVDQILSVAKAGLEYASSLGEVATQLGVTTKSLQEYRYAASQAGVEQGEMDQALSQLTRRLGDAAQGSKSIQAAFDKLGVSVRDANGHVRDAGDVIPLIADGLQKIESPAERAAILVDLFGKAGQKLAPLLEGGAAGVNNLRDAAHKLGIVLDDGVIQDADDAADKLSAMKQVMEAKIAGFVASNIEQITTLADKLFRLADAALKAADAWAKWVGGEGPGGRLALEQNARIRDPGFTNGTATTRAASNLPTTTRVVPLTNNLGETFTGTKRMRLPKGGRGGGGGSNAFGSLLSLGQSPGAFASKAAEGGLTRMAQAANDMAKPAASIAASFASMAGTDAPRLLETIRKMAPELDRLRDATQGILDRLFPDEAEARRYAEELAILNTALAKGQISLNTHAGAVTALRREYSGFTAAIEEAAIVLSTQVGPSLDEISDAISDRLPQELGQFGDKTKTETVRIASSFADMAESISSSLGSIVGGKTGGILSSLLNIGLQLGKSGAFGGDVSSFLNRIPARARGGPVSAGTPYLVGENGPEMMIPGRSGMVVPNHELSLVPPPSGARVRPGGSNGGMTNVQIIPSPYFTAVVDGRIQAAAPSIARAGAAGGVAQIARTQRRRFA